MWSTVKCRGFRLISFTERNVLSEIGGTFFKFRDILYIMSLQKASTSERVKAFKWHLITTQIRPIAHILVVCILNNLNLCQL